MLTITIEYIPKQREGFTEYLVSATCEGVTRFGCTVDQAVGRLISDHSMRFGIEMTFVPPPEVSNAFQR